MTTDVDKIKKGKLNEEAFYKVDDGRFDDW
jgi:hypothetical protein